MKRIGNNEFFATERGAKTAGSRRGYRTGATITATDEGFCLLSLGEGADDKSYRTLATGCIIWELQDSGWVSAHGGAR
jgi:hypothetical protein